MSHMTTRIVQWENWGSWILGSIIALGLSTTCLAQSQPHLVGGLSALDAFGDERLVSLADAACAGDTQAIDNLVAKAVDPNGQGYQGVTPLAWAISCRNVRGVEGLLIAGADPNMAIADSFNPVFQAAGYVQNPEVLSVLLEYGGAPDGLLEGSIQGALGEALEYGSIEDRWENWHLLLNSGASVRGEVGRDLIASCIRLQEYRRLGEILEAGYDGDMGEVESLLRNFPYVGDDPSTMRDWEVLLAKVTRINRQ